MSKPNVSDHHVSRSYTIRGLGEASSNEATAAALDRLIDQINALPWVSRAVQDGTGVRVHLCNELSHGTQRILDSIIELLIADTLRGHLDS